MDDKTMFGYIICFIIGWVVSGCLGRLVYKLIRFSLADILEFLRIPTFIQGLFLMVALPVGFAIFGCGMLSWGVIAYWSYIQNDMVGVFEAFGFGVLSVLFARLIDTEGRFA